ncbi:unnamed protein product [Urochloa humidicola]
MLVLVPCHFQRVETGEAAPAAGQGRRCTARVRGSGVGSRLRGESGDSWRGRRRRGWLRGHGDAGKQCTSSSVTDCAGPSVDHNGQGRSTLSTFSGAVTCSVPNVEDPAFPPEPVHVVV